MKNGYYNNEYFSENEELFIFYCDGQTCSLINDAYKTKCTETNDVGLIYKSNQIYKVCYSPSNYIDLYKSDNYKIDWHYYILNISKSNNLPGVILKDNKSRLILVKLEDYGIIQIKGK